MLAGDFPGVPAQKNTSSEKQPQSEVGRACVPSTDRQSHDRTTVFLSREAVSCANQPVLAPGTFCPTVNALAVSQPRYQSS